MNEYVYVVMERVDYEGEYFVAACSGEGFVYEIVISRNIFDECRVYKVHIDCPNGAEEIPIREIEEKVMSRKRLGNKNDESGRRDI